MANISSTSNKQQNKYRVSTTDNRTTRCGFKKIYILTETVRNSVTDSAETYTDSCVL